MRAWLAALVVSEFKKGILQKGEMMNGNEMLEKLGEATLEEMETVVLDALEDEANWARFHYNRISFPKKAVKKAQDDFVKAIRLLVYTETLIAELRELRAKQ